MSLPREGRVFELLYLYDSFPPFYEQWYTIDRKFDDGISEFCVPVTSTVPEKWRKKLDAIRL